MRKILSLLMILSTSIILSAESKLSLTVVPSILPSIIPFIDNMEKSLNDFLNGKDVAKSFYPIPVKSKKYRINSIYQKLKSNNIKNIKLIGMEFELIFYDTISPQYYLRSMVRKNEKSNIQFFSMSGKNMKGRELYIEGQPLKVFTDYALPLQKGADEFLKELKSRHCRFLPFVSKKELFHMLRGSSRAKSAYKDLIRSKGKVNKICSDLKYIKWTEVHLRLDDMVFACYNSKGKGIGMLKMDIHTSMDSIIFFDMVRFIDYK